MVGMHLVPAERAHRHTIDDHRVCDAIAGIGDVEDLHRLSATFALLADPTRLILLSAIAAAPGIAVTDLAVAAGMNESTVSQSLRLLRAAALVTGRKDGRIVRYSLLAEQTAALIRTLRGHGERTRDPH